MLNSLIAEDVSDYRAAWTRLCSGVATPVAKEAGGGEHNEAAVASAMKEVWQDGLRQVAFAAAALTPAGPVPKVLQRTRRLQGKADATLPNIVSAREWETLPATTSVELLFGQAGAAGAFLRHRLQVIPFPFVQKLFLNLVYEPRFGPLCATKKYKFLIIHITSDFLNNFYEKNDVKVRK